MKIISIIIKPKKKVKNLNIIFSLYFFVRQDKSHFKVDGEGKRLRDGESLGRVEDLPWTTLH